MAQPRLNLRGLTALLVDRNHYYRSLVSQMLHGFGMQNIATCDSGETAQEYLKDNPPVDLCLIEADLPDLPGPELIRWIRREQKEPLRFVPILVLTGYAQLRQVAAARDAGANLILRKPISAQALFDRINWVGRTRRAYVETASYVGPDRRFRDMAPPDRAYKRVTDDAKDTSPEPAPADAAPENAGAPT